MHSSGADLGDLNSRGYEDTGTSTSTTRASQLQGVQELVQGMDQHSLQQLQGYLARMQQNALPGQTQIQFAPLNPPAVVLSQEEQAKLDYLIKQQKV